MMQNRKKYILGTSAGLILLLMILLRTAVWGDFIQEKINQRIVASGWSVHVGQSSGTLFGTTHFRNVELKHSGTQRIHIKRSTVNFGYIASLFGDLTFDLVSIEGMTFQLDQSWTWRDSSQFESKPIHLPVNIKSFFIAGQVGSLINEQSFNINIKTGGEFFGGNRPKIQCDLLKIHVDENPDNALDFQRLALGYDGTSFYLNDLKGRVLGYPIKGTMVYNNQQPHLSGNVRVSGFTIPDELFRQLPLQAKFSSFAGQFDFESDLKYFDGELVLENDLGLDMKGEFSVGKEKAAWVLKNLQLTGEKSQLTVNGLYQEGARASCYMNLNDLDLSRWMTDQVPTKMSGLVILDGGLTKSGSLDQIDLTLEMIESKLHDKGDISIYGQISYQDSIISTLDPVMVMVGDSYLTIDGEGNFENKNLNILADLENAEIELVNRFLPGDFISGKATGRLNVRGDFFSPSVTAELSCENINVEDFNLESLEFNSQMTVTDTLTSGFVAMKTGRGTWKERAFESGTVNATIENNQVVIENFHFKSGKDYLQASGTFDGEDEYKIDRLQLAYENHYLVNSRPLSFSFRDSVLLVKPFEFHINDGMMEGVITGGDTPEGRFKMSNFDAKIMTQFFSDKRLHFSGLIFGEVWVQWSQDGLDLDADLSLKSGLYMEEPFEEMTLSFLYKNGMLHMDDISMTRKGAMGFQANGIIPMGKSLVDRTPISLRSTFSNLPLKFVQKFIPDFFTLGGNATGSIHLKGFPDNTNFTFDLDIDNGVFDLVELGRIKGIGKYDGRRLFVESAEATRKDGIIKAYGSVPFDFNLSSSRRGRFFIGDSLDFHATGQLGSLPFLSPYIADLDSVRGDFDIALSLSGPVEALQRSGHLRVKNGKIYTLLISDPATSIAGEAFMNHNQLVIQNMSGTLFHDSGKYQKPEKQNTKITGSMDFTQFFNPGYDLEVKSKEASFKTLYLDITGQSNMDVTITGRDTVTIGGAIEALDANVFYEFTTEELGTALPEETGTVMAYQITIPIRGNALFQNSQIDAKVTGELSLSQIGHQEMDFAGEIFVEDGSVFSYKDNFKELQGYVSFDNKGFNPIMDVNAFTMIDDERIDLRIIGGIDDMNISLESASGFSESDILELLTWGKRFEEQELTSTGFGNQTVSILGSLLENQLEKNLKDSEIGKLGLVDDIHITGTAGLLQGADEDFEVTAQRQIGDKTFLNLSYKRSFSLTNPNQSQIGVEYKLNRHFSVVGNIDEDGNLNLKYRYRYAY
jgi:hypothetical protein